MAGNSRSQTAKRVFAWVLAAIVAAGVGVSIWVGVRYGMFSELSPNLRSIPNGFRDESTAPAFVEFIDVGEGDAALIGIEEHYMLIDTGPRDDNDAVINTLVKQGVSKLDYLVLSHPHADHIGEAAEIIEKFPIGCIIAPEVPEELIPDKYSYNALIGAAEAAQLDIHTAADEHFALGDCQFDIYVPKNDYEELNDYSLLLMLHHGDNRFLFTGDSEQPEEEEFIGRGTDLSADVLKAGHHGGRDSCCAEFLARVQPKYTVISCGADNDNGHPNRETLRRLKKFSSEVLLTSTWGTVRFESNGSRITLVGESKNAESITENSSGDQNDTEQYYESGDEASEESNDEYENDGY